MTKAHSSNACIFRMPPVAREAAWVCLGQAAAAIGALVSVRILTELLSATDYGALALALTISGLFQSVVFAGPGNAGLRFYSTALERDELPGFWSGLTWSLRVRLRAALICGLIALLALSALASREVIAVAVPCCLLAIATGLPGILDGVQNAARNRVIVAVHQALGTWLRLAFAVLLMLMIGARPDIAMWALSAASLLVLVSQWFFFAQTFPAFFKEPNADLALQWRDRIERYGWPFVLWGLPYWLQTASERWSLEVFSTTEEVGKYTVLSQLGYSPIILLTNLMVQFAAPVIFARIGSGADPERAAGAVRLNLRLLLLAGVVGGGATLATWLLSDVLLSLFAAASYAAVAPMLPLVVLSGALFAMGQIASIPLMASHTSRLLPPKIVIPLAGTVANAWAASMWGTLGVVLASLAASFLYFFWIVFLSLRSTRLGSPPHVIDDPGRDARHK